LAADNIVLVDNIGAGHGFVTTDHGVACTTTGSPFINDCDYDQAGAILAAIYGELSPPADSLGGRILVFDQGEFVAQPASHSMGDVGYVYIPTVCEQGDAGCRLHVVFHGCKQSRADIGDQFYTRTGYNRWADANGIVVLYPQAVPGSGNPNGCWDWWGYNGADYHTRSGTQMAAVKAMVMRLAGDDESPPTSPFCQVHPGSNYSHWMAGRAHFCNFWFICANGSNDNLGWLFSSVTLYEHPEGTFSTTECP
jgi:poly(3-hydroxybutyrate) depolymerase